MFSMIFLELSYERRLRREEYNSISKVAPSPIAHAELLKPTCQIHSYKLMFKTKYVILARIKGCVVVSNDRVEKQQHYSDESTLFQ